MSRVFTDEGVKLVMLTTVPVGDLKALKVATLTAGLDVSDYTVAGESQFEMAASDTVTEKRYSDKGKVEIPTTKNQNVKGVFYRSRDEVTFAIDTDDPIKGKLDDRQEVVFIKRKGVPVDVAWAVGQDYEYYRVKADELVSMNDNDGGFEKMTVGFRPSGAVGVDGVVAAAV
jgi:hypothetical protein